MFFERKYPLCYNIPYDDASCGVPVTVEKTRYVATDGKFIYSLEEKSHSYEFARQKASEPKVRLSNFEGCPHWYGIMYMPNGDCYELQCKITKQYLEEAHQMRGDWSGYKEGDYTGRFLSKSQIMTAFNLLKEIVK